VSRELSRLRRAVVCWMMSSSAPVRPATFLRTIVLAACITLVAFVAATASRAAPAWLSPQDLSSPGRDALVPEVAVDPRGNVVAVWAQATATYWVIEAARHPVGRAWSRPVVISRASNDASTPRVVVDGKGNAVAVWQWFTGKKSIVQSARYASANGRWSPPRTLSAAGRDAIAPRVAINERGDLVAAWTTAAPAGWAVQAAYRRAGGSWESAKDLVTPVEGAASPDVAVDAAGRAAAVWAASTGSAWTVEGSYRSRSGPWESVSTLSPPSRAEAVAPQVALDPNGDAEAVWSQSTASGNLIVRSTRSLASGTWSLPRAVSPTGRDGVEPQIITNARGDAAILWTSTAASGLVASAVYRRAGGDWSGTVLVSGPTSGPLSPRIALDGEGNAVAVWSRATAGHSLVQTATRAAITGKWTAPLTLSRPGADALTPAVALSRKGDGAIVWSRYVKTKFVVQGDGYDSSGPELIKLSVPASGVIRAELRFSVSPTDVWSGLRSVRWSFGDGGTAPGTVATHAYDRPGRYAVRVIAQDTKGHATSASRFVSITAS
jgi:PKD domain